MNEQDYVNQYESELSKGIRKLRIRYFFGMSLNGTHQQINSRLYDIQFEMEKEDFDSRELKSEKILNMKKTILELKVLEAREIFGV